MAEATKNESPSKPVQEIDPDAPADVEAHNTFRDDPIRIQQWIVYLRQQGTQKADKEIEGWEQRLAELGSIPPVV